MVELVPLVGHRHRVDDLAVGRRAGLHVDHRERVGLREVRAQIHVAGHNLGLLMRLLIGAGTDNRVRLRQV